ncbi:MAG: putative quinol monooxygenase [Planctomycetales bacterium]
MIYLHVWLKVKDPQHVPEIRNHLTAAAQSSRQEPGCARFEAYQSESDNTRFLLCEQWESQAHLDQHRLGHAYLNIYKPLVLPLVDREPHPSQPLL